MVGEEAQEMQLAGWLPTTPVGVAIPNWLGVWFSLFPTRETLVAQLVAAVIVLGSYFGGQYLMVWRKRT
jgi:high-affinity iron transporter